MPSASAIIHGGQPRFVPKLSNASRSSFVRFELFFFLSPALPALLFPGQFNERLGHLKPRLPVLDILLQRSRPLGKLGHLLLLFALALPARLLRFQDLHSRL